MINQIRLPGGFAIPPVFIAIGFIAIGFLAGLWLLGRIGPPRGIPAEEISAIGFWSLLGGIVGARLFYVVGHYGEFGSPMSMLQIYNGGLSLLGGIAGAVLINLPRLRRRGYHFFQVADGVAPALAFGIAIGRIGDLIVGDHLGTPTSSWFAWTYHGGTLPQPWACGAGLCQLTLDDGRALEVLSRTGAKMLDAQGRVIAQGAGVHQTAMYDLALASALFALLWMLGHRPRRKGIITLTFALGYGLGRILEDSVRTDKRFGALTGSQWASVGIVIVSGALLVWWARHPDPGDDGPPPVARPEPVGLAPEAGTGTRRIRARPADSSAADVSLYQGSQCHALAATIVRLRPGWRMVAVTDRYVAAQAPDGRCFDLYGWAAWDHVREVDLEELNLLGFVEPRFDERVEDVARRLLAVHDAAGEQRELHRPDVADSGI